MTGRPDRPWRHRDFRFVVGGRFVDMLGNAMAPIALAYAVLDMTGSLADLGLVVGARSAANVALLLFGGVLADRWRRSIVLVWSNVVSALTQGTVAMLVLTGQATLTRLVLLSVVNGATASVSFPASMAVLPQTVPPALVPQANAINGLGMNGAAIAGASLAGLIVAATSPGWGLAVDAATFALAGVAYGLIRVGAPVRRKGSTTWQDLREGWTAFTSQTWIWAVVGAFALVNAAWVGGVNVLGPAVADQTIGRAWWGIVLGCETAGMVLGGLVALRVQPKRPLRVGVLCTISFAALPFALALHPVVPVLVVAALISGLSVETFGIAWNTSLQRHVPTDRLARVYSYDAFGSFIAIPIGEVAVGPIAEVAGTRPVLLGTAIVIVVAALAALTSRSVRDLTATPDTGEPTDDVAPTLAGA